MSAIAAICWPDIGITLASDAITYDSDGTVKGFVAKVLPVPEMNCVLANVGIGGFAAQMRDILTLSCTCFDDVLDNLAAGAASAWAARQTQANATVLAGGWSDRKSCFSLYKLHTKPRAVIDGGREITVPAGEPIAIKGFYCSYAPSPEACERAGIGANGKAAELLGRYVCAARMDSSMSGSGEHEGVPFFVGGFLQITEVRKDQTMIHIAHRWPDTAGLPFDCNAGELLPSSWPD